MFCNVIVTFRWFNNASATMIKCFNLRPSLPINKQKLLATSACTLSLDHTYT